MLEQAQTAERLCYHGVTIPEHHLINILLTPLTLANGGESGQCDGAY